MSNKFHSNFVQSFINFRAARAGNGIVIRKVNEANLNVEHYRDPICCQCRMLIQHELEYSHSMSIMIRKIEDLEKRLKEVEEIKNKFAEQRDQVIAENNEFRLIGLADNPVKQPDGIIIEEFYANTHLAGIASWPVESIQMFVNKIQHHASIFVKELQRRKDKTSIEIHVKDLRQAEQKASAGIAAGIDEKAAKRKKEYKQFDTLVESICKSARCDKKSAIAQLKSMGMVAPKGYEELI